MADEPLQHIRRQASFPWRPLEDVLPECGKATIKAEQMISLDEFVAKVGKLGKQRAAFSTCMTCWDTCQRYKQWSVDPVDAVRREVYGQRGYEQQFRQELWALAALVEAHRDEFDGFINGLGETTDLSQKRRAKLRIFRPG